MTLPALAAALAGRYTLERELGAGGMATVYLAHDERHERRVALKVLRPELAAVIGAARFLAEIKTTANLQHPHILPLHDSGEVNGTVWYVMPLVEGESLRDRLARETQLPIEDALSIAREIASALDYAHRHGVIHRDIKPENILLHDGRAMVADFGIALAVSRSDGGTRMTETGMSLGTPHYMSPEQALGERTVDARTDVYALGCVLYEMLAGEPPFTGPTAQAIIAKVMNSAPPPISAMRATVPPGVEAAVMRALAKIPADRFRSAAEFAAALQGAGSWTPVAAAQNGATVMAPARAGTPGPSPSLAAQTARYAPWGIAAGALIFAGVVGMSGSRTVTSAPVTAAVLPLPLRTPTDLPLNEVGPSVSLAPDGSFVVYVGPDPDVPGTTALWRRPLDRLEATPIPGTRGAQRPQVQPDGRSVWFFKRAPDGNRNDRWEATLDGSGLPVHVPFTQGLKRLHDGRLLVRSADSGLAIIRAGDPFPSARAPVLRDDAMRGHLDVSPDGVWIARSRRRGQTDSILVRAIEQAEPHVLAAGTTPTFIDHDLLAFRAADGTLQVGRLNAGRTGFVAPPIPMATNVAEAGDGNGIFAIALDGTLIYALGSSSAQSRLTWVDASGLEVAIPNAEPRVYGGVAVSPDGRRAALSIGVLTGGGDVWIADLASGALSPLTSNGTSSRPSWRRDGRTVTYLHTTVGATSPARRTSAAVSMRAFDTSAPAESLAGPWPTWGVDELVWSPDEHYVAIRSRLLAPTSGRDVLVRRVDGDSVVPFAAEENVQERSPRISPDGQWLLYVSDRSGRDEVYAESFPGGGNRVQLSTDGGREPVWSRDGTRVFYRGLDGWMLAARLTRGTQLAVTARERLFDATPYLANQFLTMYDVAPDGRFLMIKLEPQPARTDVVIIRNWVQQVRARLAPVD